MSRSALNAPVLSSPSEMMGAFGSLAGIASENQLRQQQTGAVALQNARSLDLLNYLRRAQGMPPIGLSDLQSGQGALGFGAGNPASGPTTPASTMPGPMTSAPMTPNAAVPGANSASPAASGSTGGWGAAHNNPGDLRQPGVYASPSAGGFQSFPTPADGVAHIARQLQRYASGATTGQPVNTLSGIVSTWSPPSENQTNALIARASLVTGFKPDEKLDLSDPDTMSKLIEATIRNENGGTLPKRFPMSLISQVAAAATAPPAQPGGTAPIVPVSTTPLPGSNYPVAPTAPGALPPGSLTPVAVAANAARAAGAPNGAVSPPVVPPAAAAGGAPGTAPIAGGAAAGVQALPPVIQAAMAANSGASGGGSAAPPVAPAPGAIPPAFGSLAPAAPGRSAAPNPGEALLTATFKQYLGLPLTPLDSAILSASMYPVGSPQQRLAAMAVIKAAGVSPFVGGERPGVPIRQYNPATGGYDIVAQNPRMGEGQTYGPNGTVANAPGYIPALAASESTKAWSRVAPEIATAMLTPRVLSPTDSLVVPGAMGGGNGASSVAPAAPGAPGLGVGGVLQPGAAPGVLRQGLNPMYQGAVQTAVTADQNRISKELQGQADKANDTMATSQLIGDLLPRVKTGWTAGTMADAARIMAAVGVDPARITFFLHTNPASADVLEKQFLAQTAQAVRTMGAREPGSVISMFTKAYPKLETQPGATQLLENVLFMQGQRAHDEYSLAQAQHTAALNALSKGQNYQPLSQFEAAFNSTTGPHSSLNYLRAAQALSGDSAAWKGLKGDAANVVWALIPSGRQYLAPDGKMRIKGGS
jgi:hypothetical protein